MKEIMNNILNYLDNYDVSLKEKPFNEVDALLLSELAYFPYDKIGHKNIYKYNDIEPFISSYVPSNNMKRKSWDIELLNKVIHSKRFEGLKVCYFTKEKSLEREKQFQAVTFLFNKTIYVAYAGTDASIVGWKEDLNLSFDEVIPSDIAALGYLKKIMNRFRFAPIYVGGHSKGGRLAVYALKHINKVKRIRAVYSFDGPGFKSSFYDEKYEIVKPLVHKIIPSESIIGRLFTKEDNVVVIKAYSKSIVQHDPYNWMIGNGEFIIDENGDSDSHLANVINSYLEGHSDEEKKLVINTIFDLFNDLNITGFGNVDYNKVLAKYALKNFGSVYSSLPKENRDSFRELISFIIKATIKEYLGLHK